MMPESSASEGCRQISSRSSQTKLPRPRHNINCSLDNQYLTASLLKNGLFRHELPLKERGREWPQLLLQ